MQDVQGWVPNAREMMVLDTRYIVPYRVRGDTIEILRVFHTSRRLPQSPPRHRLDRQPKRAMPMPRF